MRYSQVQWIKFTFVTSTSKFLLSFSAMHNGARSGLISNSELQIVNKLPIIHQSCQKVATNNILKEKVRKVTSLRSRKTWKDFLEISKKQSTQVGMGRGCKNFYSCSQQKIFKYLIPMDTGTQTEMSFSIVLSAVLIRP